jgi:hypothetical protein
MPRHALLALAAAVLCLPATAQARRPPLFDVGTAVVDISPDTPQYLGGYDTMATPTAVAHDPLQVRAFFVGRGKHAVAFAIVDSQGWFAGYQEGPYGVTEARQEAAGRLKTLGYDAGPGNLIVSSTHSHAAPTIMGIWGPTDPAYLKRVHDATVQAIATAAAHTQRAELWTGEGSINELIAHNVEGTDHFDGWGIDATTPVLWARAPRTGATVGLYTNVPVHADQFRGSKFGQASADHPGAERADLDRLLGGTAVVAMGTLGRQEAMGGIDDYSEVERQGAYITNAITRALAAARPIMATEIAGAEQYISVPAHNAALLALLYDNLRGFECLPDPVGTCTIDRSVLPPYLAGNEIGTWVTALRIGDAAWVSEPGEAFNEVSSAVRDSVSGAREVHVVGMAQDQLGYYYPPEDYPASEINPSDFILFNVSPALADASVAGAATAANAVGFTGSTPRHPVIDDEHPDYFLHAGTQFWPSLVESVGATREFLVGAKPSQAPVAPGQPDHTVSPATVDFGDGTPPETVLGGRPAGQQPDGREERITHTFPGPGRYTVRTTVTDEQGVERSFASEVVVDPPLQATGTASAHGARIDFAAGLDGGDGHAIAAHWAFSDGTGDDGLTVSHAASSGLTATLTVVDAAGDSATTTVTAP